jgi:antitoxin component of MazEF toxin-antitoxin module
MLNFGQRSIFKQGGSFLISLPIQWIRSTNPENVKIEVDNEQRIIITSVSQACQDSTESVGITQTI